MEEWLATEEEELLITDAEQNDMNKERAKP